jgi:hypothetical protein
LRSRHNTATARRWWLLLAFPPLAALALAVALVAPASAAPVIETNIHVAVSGLVTEPGRESPWLQPGDESPRPALDKHLF